jgi:hypothetical protein
MNDLVVVVEDLVVKDGKREWVRKYLDFLCSDANSGKNDFHYIHTVFQWLTEQRVFKENHRCCYLVIILVSTSKIVAQWST